MDLIKYDWAYFLSDEHPTRGTIERAIRQAEAESGVAEPATIRDARAAFRAELLGLLFYASRANRPFELSALVNCRQAYAKLRQLIELYQD